MVIDEALQLLGIERNDPDPDQIRVAYLEAVRRVHPDINSHPDAGFRAARITEAYHFLRRNPPTRTATPTPPPPPTPEPVVVAPSPPEPFDEFGIRIIADDTIEIDLPTDLAAQFLYSSAHNVGEVIYLERSSGLMQLLVRFVDEPICQIILDLQGRAARGTTEVFCSVASMDHRPPPPMDGITRFIVERLTVSADVTPPGHR